MNCKTYKVEQMIHLLYFVGLTIHLTHSVEQYQMMHRISAIASFYIRVSVRALGMTELRRRGGRARYPPSSCFLIRSGDITA